MIIKLNLQMFAEEGATAAPETGAAETATAAENTAPSAPIREGDTLPDGSKVQSARVAAALERQMSRHPNLRKVYGQGQNPAAGAPEGQKQEAGAEEQPAGKTIQERWEEAKKGEFAEMYGADVQNAIKDRFKNQEDANNKLNALEPMLKVLRERAGVENNDDLVAKVLDDDSLYEEKANEAGMTIDAYKMFEKVKAERDAMKAQEEQTQQEQMIKQHLAKLSQQAAELKKSFPDFDLMREIKNNPTFKRLTSPYVGLSVEDAFMAVHHKELAPKMMQYGMQRAKEQMGQTIQARGNRPQEGAMRGGSQEAAGPIKIDPRSLTRAQREEIKRQVRMGKVISFD